MRVTNNQDIQIVGEADDLVQELEDRFTALELANHSLSHTKEVQEVFDWQGRQKKSGHCTTGL